jgi:hypothetical protein
MYPDTVLDRETFSNDWVEIESDRQDLEWEELLLSFGQETETNSISTFGKSS